MLLAFTFLVVAAVSFIVGGVIGVEVGLYYGRNHGDIEVSCEKEDAGK